ncbi:MAG: EAL domain-containing protein, partial [Candidatus Rokuibacteriota bacterium]
MGSEPSLELVGSAGDAAGAADVCNRERPDVALVDVRMPGGGAAATRQILARSHNTRVVAFSGHSDRATILEMVAAGASGYLVKGCSEREIVETVLRTGLGQANPATETTAAVILDVSAQVRAQEREFEEQRRRRERCEKVIETRAVSMVFQAIADLNTGRVVGAEALARFRDERSRGPDWWFSEARAVGLLVELEVITLALALERLPELPSDVALAINLSPETLATSAFADELAEVPGERVTIEMTEHARVDDYEELATTLSGVRGRGSASR